MINWNLYICLFNEMNRNIIFNEKQSDGHIESPSNAYADTKLNLSSVCGYDAVLTF